jgi:hypothetical protein
MGKRSFARQHSTSTRPRNNSDRGRFYSDTPRINFDTFRIYSDKTRFSPESTAMQQTYIVQVKTIKVKILLRCVSKAVYIGGV